LDISDLKRKSLLNYKPYTYGEQPDPNEKWIKLNTNENAYQPPQIVLDEIKAAVNEKLRLYPDPTCLELRKLLLSKYFVQYNEMIKLDNLIVANGSDEVIDILFKAFIDSGDIVVFFNPSYGMYPVVADLYGAKSQIIELTDRFEIPEGIDQVKGKMMIICSPNNPSGMSVPNSIIESICKKFPGLVVVDEAYEDFSSTTAISLISKYKNLAVMRTFSKGFCLASERIGILVANSQIVQFMMDVKLPYNVSYLSQVSANASLKHIEIFKEMHKEIIAERAKVTNGMRKLKLEVLPSDANFILVKLPSAEIAMKFFTECKVNKILIRQYNKKELLPYLRISIGKPEENVILLKVFQETAKKVMK
jgi:histidinol-phosphate aminotransferase